MDTPPQTGRDRSFATPVRRRRRFSVWTVLAPVAVIVLWVAFFTSLGNSCVLKECKDDGDSTAEAEEASDKQNDVTRGGRAKVLQGDSMGSIAAKYDLTEEELKACNPKVDPQALQPGQRLLVSAIDCEDADRAEVGANPDPLADDIAGPGKAPTEDNGTAAADPSANPDAAGAKAQTAADQGDEG